MTFNKLIDLYDAIRNSEKNLKKIINEHSFDSREKEIALKKLEKVILYTKSLVRNLERKKSSRIENKLKDEKLGELPSSKSDGKVLGLTGKNIGFTETSYGDFTGIQCETGIQGFTGIHEMPDNFTGMRSMGRLKYRRNG